MPSRPTRVSRRRSNKKWAPVLVQDATSVTIPQGGSRLLLIPLCSNSINTSAAPTATIIKAGNFKVCVDINLNDQTFDGVGRAYVMYVPQGVTLEDPSVSFPGQHPEWIMCWRGFEPGNGNLQVVNMQSKLKRNLNSGDRILMVIAVSNLSSGAVTFQASVGASYVCCNN